jgi:hypothetical protein
MDYLNLPDNAARQIIDSMTVFSEHRRVLSEARKYVGGMYWKRQGDYVYLVKTTPDNRQQRLGPRSVQTEETYHAFIQRKHETESRLKSLQEALTEAERLNKAVKAGRVPNLVVTLLQTLDAAGLGMYFTTVGTHALYAYEAAAGVRIVQGALATQDVDLLWDARRRLQFMTQLKHIDSSVLRILQRADPTFRRKEMQAETAINAKGFEVDFLRRMAVHDDPHPFRFSDDEEDIWPVQADRAAVLTDASKFEHVVISVTGRMALMRTVAPETFIHFKRWMAESAPNRAPLKRQRDLRQAQIVQSLLDERLLQTPG